MTSDDAHNLKRYRHLIASMISESLGYFTPLMAFDAIKAHKEKRPCYFEWYIDMRMKRRLYNRNDVDKTNDQLHIDINRDVIRSAFTRRHRSGYKRVLPIVDRNIAGYESIGASWFC